MFGVDPSEPAKTAVEMFRREKVTKILELGAGQGRDTLFFAKNGIEVHALDYADSAVRAISGKAAEHHLSGRITASRHDVRDPLPFEAGSFGGCYSHMLYCMALETPELAFLAREVWRVLRPGGLQIYTVRNTKDAHYREGIARGDDLYEVGGFIVHFFSREKVAQLAEGFDIIGVDEFEEGRLPRKLFRVTLRKRGS